jgi:hypothetical protein
VRGRQRGIKLDPSTMLSGWSVRPWQPVPTPGRPPDGAGDGWGEGGSMRSPDLRKPIRHD